VLFHLRAQAGPTALLAALLLYPALVPEAHAGPRDRRPGFLSAPRSATPERIARDVLRQRHAELRGADELERAEMRTRRLRRARAHHVRLRQRLHGIPVRRSELGVLIAEDGSVAHTSGRFVRRLRDRAPGPTPPLGARAAIRHAAQHLGLEPAGPLERLDPFDGPEQRTRFSPAGLSLDPIPVRLSYVARGDQVHLAWHLALRVPAGAHWWSLYVDAATGEILEQNDWVEHESYRVFPLPTMSPDHGPRMLKANLADPQASPFGWHDTDGLAGAEFTDTRGNNVSAQEDQNSNNVGGFRPEPNTPFAFDFPLDLSLDPTDYQPAAITNLFYMVNVLHDIFHHYGFDEAAGNFQELNYGGMGEGSDSVMADAQDGLSINNANFSTPPDGSNPRMQMFLWTDPQFQQLTVNAPGAIAGDYSVTGNAFAPQTPAGGLTADLMLAADPIDPSNWQACSPLPAGLLAGKIALVQRKPCLFVEKVQIVQDAGAVGAIIANNAGDGLVTMTGATGDIAIPALFIGQTDGETLLLALPGVTVTMVDTARRDGDLDNGIIIHEFGHGITTRLTGGPDDSDCLVDYQPDAMAEGWGDWFALVLTSTSADLPDDQRPIASYTHAHPLEGPGIRDFAYTSDLGLNPRDYDDLGSLSQPHGHGEIWAALLWEFYLNMVESHGFDLDFYQGSGGNNVALQLVVDGLVVQGCNPGFTQARDAILAADLALTGGENRCLAWSGFAKRGLGFSADPNGSIATSSSGTSGFDVPAECVPTCGDGLLQAGERCDDSNTTPGDGCDPACQPEGDLLFTGVAAGGTVSVTVAGIPVQRATAPGMSASDIAAILAAAIRDEPAIAAQGVRAVNDGTSVLTTGTVTGFSIDDAGLAPPVDMFPELPFWAIAALLGLVALSYAGYTHSRR